MPSNIPINLVSGTVDLITKGKARRVRFVEAIVIGRDLAEVRSNFQYSKTFLGRDGAKDRKAMEEMEAEGRVRLVEITITRTVGVTNY